MSIFITLLFAIAANLDTLGVAIAYGTKNIKIKVYLYFIIAFISTFGTLISMLIGFTLIKSNLLNKSYLNLIGSLLLFVIGIWFIKDFFVEIHKKEVKIYNDILMNPSTFDKDNSGDINLRECITLSIALTINNIGVGIGASVIGLNIWILCAFTYIITILLLIIGISIGKNFMAKIFGKYSPLISGLMIILIAIYEIINI